MAKIKSLHPQDYYYPVKNHYIGRAVFGLEYMVKNGEYYSGTCGILLNNRQEQIRFHGIEIEFDEGEERPKPPKFPLYCAVTFNGCYNKGDYEKYQGYIGRVNSYPYYTNKGRRYFAVRMIGADTTTYIYEDQLTLLETKCSF